MQLLFFCSRWGSEKIPWELFIENIKQAGFDGIEAGLPENDREAEQLMKLIRNSGLDCILQHYETTTPDFKTHKETYIRRLERMMFYKPLRVNSNTGRDIFSIDNNIELLQTAHQISTSAAIPISHETHRSRFSYAAHATAPFLKLEWLKLTWDISHWICVAESLLEDQQHVINDTIPHVAHLHARFGHTQGPQIGDINDQTWRATKNRHLEVWLKTVSHAKQNGAKNFCITTEFGPPPYMPFVPKGKTAIAHQFDLNVKMKSFLEQHLKFLQI